MSKIAAALLLLLAFTNPVLSQIPGGNGIVINNTPVQGGISGDCLTVSASLKVSQVVCGGAPSGAAGGVLSGTYPNPGFAAIATNTALANATSGSAAPTAIAVPSCSTASSALTWTTNTGFGCNSIASGSGTVTSVSVTTANGVSGTVATATTTPAITLTLGAITPSSVVSSGPITVTSASAQALAVGLTGATNPAFSVDASTASQASGLNVLGGTTSGAVALRILSSGTNNNLTVDAKGSGTLVFNATATGNITLSRTTTVSAGNLNISNGNVSLNSASGVVQLNSGNLVLSNGGGTIGNLKVGPLTDPASGSNPSIVSFAGNSGSATNGPLATITGPLGGSGVSTGGELRLQGGLTSAAGGAGGAVTVYTAPSGAATTPAVVATFANDKSVTFTGQLNVTAMTQTSAAQSGTVCYNSGTGAVTYDATLGCLTSSATFKMDIHSIQPHRALQIAMALEPVSFRKRPEFGGDVDKAIQVGFIAERVADVDERLVGRDDNGVVRGVRYQQLTAILAGAIQELKGEVDALKARR